jgi:hypothetical protein
MASEGAHGLPCPAFGVFADTGAEPQSVYRWLDWLEAHLAFPVYRVQYRDLWEQELTVVRSGRGEKRTYRKGTAPFFTGDHGMLQRRCTTDFKIRPIQTFLRKHLRKPRGLKTPFVTQWIGISTDEAHRMKPSQEPWITNAWPLIDLNLSRADCLAWMEQRGYPTPPRSACIFCPYHSDREWYRLKTEEPEAFAAAVQFEEVLQYAAQQAEVGRADIFLHSKRIPLKDVTFDLTTPKADPMGNECEGMCGV